MNFYIAGPMSGLKDNNFPAFFAVENLLRSKYGIEHIFNPAQNDLNNYGSIEKVMENAVYRECLRQDLDWICTYATHIYMMNGWENSKGARAEHATAVALGLEIWYET
jgi:hypothetical protein